MREDLVTPSGFVIRAEDLRESFVRASGPGGQNVNKVATAVRLAFDPHALPAEVRARLAALAGRRLSGEGIVVIAAQRFRTLEANRRDAALRLAHLVDAALEPPAPRHATRVPRGERLRRLEAKQHRARLKRLRGAPAD